LSWLPLACGKTAREGAEACFETPREPADDATNADVVSMAALAPPERIVPLSILLVDVDFSPSSNDETPEQVAAERQQQLELYQGPIQARLEALGATNVARASLFNDVAASIEARYVADILCWPNVVRLVVDVGYWTIADPPWTADEAGPAQCPLVDGKCDPHCFEIAASPVVDGQACLETKQVVACSRGRYYSVDNPHPVCRQRIADGERYAFQRFVPSEPDYVGFGECDGPEPAYPDPCSGGQGSE